MGKLWGLVQQWRDEHQFPPSPRQIALAIGVSQSTFKGWQDGLTELPKRRNLWELHVITNIPFAKLVDAAIEDARLHDPEIARQAAVEYRERKADREAAAAGNVIPADFRGPDPAEGAPKAAEQTPGKPSQYEQVTRDQDLAGEENQDPDSGADDIGPPSSD